MGIAEKTSDTPQQQKPGQQKARDQNSHWPLDLHNSFCGKMPVPPDITGLGTYVVGSRDLPYEFVSDEWDFLDSY